MSDTCIVCLGDLGGDANFSAITTDLVPRPDNDDGSRDASTDSPSVEAASPPRPVVLNDDDSGEIARLLPCGHILHNNCLKPWVERANSCPICRRSFNMVELTEVPGGAVLSSYAVQDKIQVADIDPSLIIEDIDEESDTQPCAICGEADNEEVLLLCDGCDVATHTYCVALDEVPCGAWYCGQCEAQRAIRGVSDPTVTRIPRRRPDQRTRAQQRRLRNRNDATSLPWARVWQSVWDRLNLDLDFPFDDEQAAEQVLQQRRRESAQQRDFRAWQRRFQVAERQGGGHRFWDPAAILDNYAPRPSRPRVPRAPTPEPESLEEMRAWNAFERARELENDPNASRKRKEPTMSPSPEPTEPERKLKRPRTRRAEELATLATQNGESSRSARLSTDSSANGPSFLQALLKEVEDASSTRNTSLGPSAQQSNPPTEHNSPRPSSPSLSPANSNYSSPLLSTSSPPPILRGRPISPVHLSPRSEYPPSFSPDHSPSLQYLSDRDAASNSAPESRPSNHRKVIRASRRFHRVPGPPTARSADNSPTRTGPSLSVKSDVQKLVGTELKPFYRQKTITKDEYTDINRTISRMLYEQIGDTDTLKAGTLAHLKEVAGKEVRKAVDALQHDRSDRDGSDS